MILLKVVSFCSDFIVPQRRPLSLMAVLALLGALLSAVALADFSGLHHISFHGVFRLTLMQQRRAIQVSIPRSRPSTLSQPRHSAASSSPSSSLTARRPSPQCSPMPLTPSSLSQVRAVVSISGILIQRMFTAVAAFPLFYCRLSLHAYLILTRLCRILECELQRRSLSHGPSLLADEH